MNSNGFEGGESRVDFPLIQQLKQELEGQLKLSQKLGDDLKAERADNLLLRQMAEHQHYQEVSGDNALHKENVRLGQEIVKRDALIDMLAKELESGSRDSQKVYVVNGANEDMLELVKLKGELKRKLAQLNQT